MRRSTQRTCSLTPFPDHVLAVTLRCGKANTKPPLPDHVVAVGLRCRKPNYKTQSSFARLDPMFPRDSSGHSPFSRRHNGKSLLRCEVVATHTNPASENVYRVCRPSFVFRHANPGATGCVSTSETGGEPTLPDVPVVAPRPPVRSTEPYSRKSTVELRLSSGRSGSDPPAPSGGVRAASCAICRQRERGTRGESNRALEVQCSWTRRLQAQTAEARCSWTETWQAQTTKTASDGLAPSGFAPAVKYSTDTVVLFWQPPSYFSQWPPSPFVVDSVPYTEQYMMAENTSLLKTIAKLSS